MRRIRIWITRATAIAVGVGGVAAGCTADPREGLADSPAEAGAGDSGRRVSTAIEPLPSSGDTSSPSDTLLGGRNGNMAKLMKRLESAGLAPVPLPTAVRHSFLSIPGTAFRIGDAELQVFIYDDSISAKRDLAKLDGETVSAPGTTAGWATKPTLIVSNNLAAIMLGRNERQIERVQLALTAGLLPPG